MTSSRQIPRPNLGQRLRMAREHAGFEQGELASRIGISRNTVGNAERGVHALRPAALEAWSAATNVDADWIREGVEERGEADDLVDEIARLVLSRARRDSNPQPSDLESDEYFCAFCVSSFRTQEALYLHLRNAHRAPPLRREDLAVAA